nr:MAG TPA: hypothetical protein [Caudoviricetes sp.]DAX19204.1 MAG TPA: hypothetical protein [Caudoviricetes sp.]
MNSISFSDITAIVSYSLFSFQPFFQFCIFAPTLCSHFSFTYLIIT